MRVLGLKHMLRLVAPQFLPMIENHHDAAADAQMTRLIYILLLRRARPYMQKRSEAESSAEVTTLAAQHLTAESRAG
jgi:DNA polymerase III epsilon subunit-like protein